MAPDNEQNLDIETTQRLRADLDRFMQSSGLSEARDMVGKNPLLLGSDVADYLSEAIKRLRQLGHVQTAESLEFRLGLLRTFRELGVQDGYLELAIDKLVASQTPEDHCRILTCYPELKGEAAAAYIKRRLKESIDIKDTDAESKYKFAATIIPATHINDSRLEGIDVTAAVNAFVSGFIEQSDFGEQRRFLESRPDLLKIPQSLLVGAMFQPFIDRARTGNRLVVLRGLLLRQALFARCREVGIAQAFKELAEGVKWKQLSSR